MKENDVQGLRVDKTYFLMLQEAVEAGKLSEDNLRKLLYGSVTAPLEIDQLLKGGEGKLTEEDCDRIGTEFPPGLYRYIKVTDDGKKPRVLCTIYMRTIEGELDEMWLGQAWKGMPPNPLDVVPLTPTYIPSLVGEPPRKLKSDREQKHPVSVLRDAQGSQGLEGRRPTLRVKFIESPDRNHLWQFPDWKVRSTTLAPVLVALREAECRKVSLSLLRKAVENNRRP